MNQPHQLEENGRRFREAWIAGVTKHFPGTPKPGYIAPWEEMAEWEQSSAIAVYDQIRQFVLATDGATSKMSREQRGRVVCLCWIGQIFKHFPNPKESYISDWEQLPDWQRETDSESELLGKPSSSAEEPRPMASSGCQWAGEPGCGETARELMTGNRSGACVNGFLSSALRRFPHTPAPPAKATEASEED